MRRDLSWFFERYHPPFLLGTWGTRWANKLGVKFDELQTWAKNAVKQRFPEHTTDGGLKKLGEERQILSVAGESADEYSIRVKDAWETWKWSGTNPGLMACGGALGWAVSKDWYAWGGWPHVWPTVGTLQIMPFSHYLRSDVDSGHYHPPQWDRTREIDPDRALTHFSRIWVIYDYYQDTGDAGTAHVRNDGTVRGTGIRGEWHYAHIDGDDARRIKSSYRKWKPADSVVQWVLILLETGGIRKVRGSGVRGDLTSRTQNRVGVIRIDDISQEPQGVLG